MDCFITVQTFRKTI